MCRACLRSANKSSLAQVVEKVEKWEEVEVDGTTWTVQPNVTAVRASYAVHVTGATGQNAALANGTYVDAGWPNCGRPTYFKDAPAAWIEFHGGIDCWIIKPWVSRGKGEGWLKSNSSAPWSQVQNPSQKAFKRGLGLGFRASSKHSCLPCCGHKRPN